MKYIDNDKEHHQVLFELGLLDDDDDWLLFQKMQRDQMDNDPDDATWHSAMGTIPREIPK
jgi:hypothetical protein